MDGPLGEGGVRKGKFLPIFSTEISKSKAVDEERRKGLKCDYAIQG